MKLSPGGAATFFVSWIGGELLTQQIGEPSIETIIPLLLPGVLSGVATYLFVREQTTPEDVLSVSRFACVVFPLAFPAAALCFWAGGGFADDVQVGSLALTTVGAIAGGLYVSRVFGRRRRTELLAAAR